MENKTIAACLAELGHETRLTVFRRLVKAGDQGLAVGDLQESLAIPAATLSHHIHRMISVGLVRQRREGRVLYCVAQLQAMREIMIFLESECCSLVTLDVS